MRGFDSHPQKKTHTHRHTHTLKIVVDSSRRWCRLGQPLGSSLQDIAVLVTSRVISDTFLVVVTWGGVDMGAKGGEGEFGRDEGRGGGYICR